MESASTIFGKNIKKLRKMKGYTQEQLADVLNTTRSCISNYELGNRQPDSETVTAMADFFDVSIDFLMGRSSVSLSIKSDEELSELQQLINSANSIKSLDIQHFSPGERNLILKFYKYLQKKDKLNKN